MCDTKQRRRRDGQMVTRNRFACALPLPIQVGNEGIDFSELRLSGIP